MYYKNTLRVTLISTAKVYSHGTKSRNELCCGSRRFPIKWPVLRKSTHWCQEINPKLLSFKALVMVVPFLWIGLSQFTPIARSR